MSLWMMNFLSHKKIPLVSSSNSRLFHGYFLITDFSHISRFLGTLSEDSLSAVGTSNGADFRYVVRVYNKFTTYRKSVKFVGRQAVA